VPHTDRGTYTTDACGCCPETPPACDTPDWGPCGSPCAAQDLYAHFYDWELVSPTPAPGANTVLSWLDGLTVPGSTVLRADGNNVEGVGYYFASEVFDPFGTGQTQFVGAASLVLAERPCGGDYVFRNAATGGVLPGPPLSETCDDESADPSQGYLVEARLQLSGGVTYFVNARSCGPVDWWVQDDRPSGGVAIRLGGEVTSLGFACEDGEFAHQTWEFVGSDPPPEIDAILGAGTHLPKFRGKFVVYAAGRSPWLTVAVAADPDAGCGPLATTLTATAEGGTPPYSYAWFRGVDSDTDTWAPVGTDSDTLSVTTGNGWERFKVVVTDSSPTPLTAYAVRVVRAAPLYWYCDGSGACVEACEPVDPAYPTGWNTQAACLGGCPGPGCPSAVAAMVISGTEDPFHPGTYCSPVTVTWAITVTGGTPPYTVTVDTGDAYAPVQVGDGPDFTFSHTYTVTDPDGACFTPQWFVTDSGGCSFEGTFAGDPAAFGGTYFCAKPCATCPDCPSTWYMPITFSGPCGTVTGTYDASGFAAMSDGSQVTAGCAGGVWTLGVDGAGCLPAGTYTGAATGVYPMTFSSGGYDITLDNPCP